MVQATLEDTVWKCKYCGHFNSRTKICARCGNPLEQEESSEKAMDPEDASTATVPDLWEKYLQKAREEWKFDEGIDPERDREKLLKIASYLQIAIANAKGPIPNVYGRMALGMLLLGEIHKAESFSYRALAQEKHNVFGWLTKLSLAILRLEGHNPWYAISDFSSGTGAFWSITTLGIAALSRSSKKGTIRTAARNLAWAFLETVRLDVEIYVDDWINTAEMLLKLADDLKRYGVNEPALYKAVATAQWDRANLGEHRERVEDLRARAHALYQLAGGR